MHKISFGEGKLGLFTQYLSVYNQKKVRKIVNRQHWGIVVSLNQICNSNA